MPVVVVVVVVGVLLVLHTYISRTSSPSVSEQEGRDQIRMNTAL